MIGHLYANDYPSPSVSANDYDPHSWLELPRKVLHIKPYGFFQDFSGSTNYYALRQTPETRYRLIGNLSEYNKHCAHYYNEAWDG